MYLILLCFGTLFGLGAFFLLAGLLRLPTSASTKAVLTVTSRGKSQKGSINAVLFDMAARLSPLVHLDGYTLIFLLCMLTRGWNTPNCAIS